MYALNPGILVSPEKLIHLNVSIMLTGEDEGEVCDFTTASASPTLAPWGHASFILAPLWGLTLGAS